MTLSSQTGSHTKKGGFGDRKHPPLPNGEKVIISETDQILKFTAVWDVALCSLVIHQRFGVTCYVHREGGTCVGVRFLRN